jgi:ribosome-binding protein aMBF1 (putative translation factor)
MTQSCRICGGPAALVCAARDGGSISLCLSCARELGRLWAARHGGS